MSLYSSTVVYCPYLIIILSWCHTDYGFNSFPSWLFFFPPWGERKRLLQKPSMFLLLNYEAGVIDTTAADASLVIDSQQQQGSWNSMDFPNYIFLKFILTTYLLNENNNKKKEVQNILYNTSTKWKLGLYKNILFSLFSPCSPWFPWNGSVNNQNGSSHIN